MVDQESGTYRPRRAFVEPDPEPAAPPPPAAIPPPPAVEEPRNGPPTGLGRPTSDFVDEDAPKPLYRDEYTPRPLYRDEPSASVPEMSDDTAGRSITFVPRPRRTDDETTAILAKGTTSSGQSRSLNGRAAPDRTDEIDDFDEDEEPSPRSERTRLALTLGAVAAVVVVGLAIGYAVFGVDSNQGTAPAPSLSAGTGSTAPTSASSDPSATTGGVLLSDGSMLSATQAKRIDPKPTWKVAKNQRGASPDAPTAACFGAEPEDGQPVPQQKILRVLSSNAKSSPSALHEATAYATPEEAVQAFAVAARTLGSCPT
ncbi:MAG TPA: hypothetical protein VGW74_14830, partial [Propionibacteriaceae bacterium]|nr:hypothetical protein [Propionibacteriaceae bacterium]